MDDDVDSEKQNRVLLRPWLENTLENQSIPGLEWFDVGKTMFRVPWKHRSKKDWSVRHSSVFLEWAKNTGRWSEGDPTPNFAQLKTRLRCAFNKAPDIDEMKDYHCSKGEEPFKVYRFNTRRGDVKSMLGRKICQKTAGRQAHRSDSPVALKYESCEEEVVDDDDAIYEESEIHSSGDIKTGLAKMDIDENNFLSSVSGGDLRNLTWMYEESVPRCQSRDSKLSVIPLTVEMMTSSSPNDDSDCDGESPENLWNRSADRNIYISGVDNVLQTAVKREVLPGNVDQIETRGDQKPASDDSADKMHLLQMASLFVEAAERKKEKDIQLDKTPEPIADSMDLLPHFSSAQYMIIMPSHCEVENLNEGSVTSGYVTPTEVLDVKFPVEEPTSSKVYTDTICTESDVYQVKIAADSTRSLKKIEGTGSVKMAVSAQQPEEAVDLTKSTRLIKQFAAQGDSRLNCHVVGQFQSNGCLDSRNSGAEEVCLSLHNGRNDVTIETQYTDVNTLKALPERATMEQIKEYFSKLTEMSRQLMEWENRLRSWEIQLQAKEETLYWRDRCFQSEVGIKSNLVRPTQSWGKGLSVNDGSSVATSATSKQPLQLKDLLTVASSVPSAISPAINGASKVVSSEQIKVATGPAISKEMPESRLNGDCIPGNNHICQSHSQSPVHKKTNRTVIKENGGKPLGSQVILLNPNGQNNGGLSSDYRHSVSLMSLIGSNQGMPLVFPVLGGSQSFMIVPQHLVPVATGMPIQPADRDAAILLRSQLESQPTAGGNSANYEVLKVQSEKCPSSNVVTGIETKIFHVEKKVRILPAVIDSENSDNSNEGNGSNVEVLNSEISPSSSVEESSEVRNVVDFGKEIDQNSKSAVSDVDWNSENVRIVMDSSVFQRVATESPELSKRLHTDFNNISLSRNTQDVTESKNDATTATDEGTQNRSNESAVLNNCQSNGTLATESEQQQQTVDFSKMLPRIVVSFPQFNMSVVDQETVGKRPPIDFTKWLRAKTEIICKEESLEGKKRIEGTEVQPQLCSESNEAVVENPSSSVSELRIHMIDREDSPKLLHLNVVSTSDVPSVSGASSPVLTPQVPLVVENENDFLEKDSADEFASKSSPFSGSSLVKRKRSFEKQNSFKKVRVDA